MRYPLLYEINTRCWLRELTEYYRRPVNLANVPEPELETWERLGFTHIWLMGVWSSGPRARAVALEDPEQSKAYSAALPGWTEADVGGSPYAIADYSVPGSLGGEVALQDLRLRLRRRGMFLVLDFVPNHVGLDHAWIRERPGLFVQSPVPESGFFREPKALGIRWLAHGKDPNFTPWKDTAQLDYRCLPAREAMSDLLNSISSRCDGVRCDMAMLVLNEIFERTWRHFPAQAPAAQGEFWEQVIAQTRQARPGFLFLAEAYWDLEPRLQALGFDYVYDKRLYDQVVARDAAGLQRWLFTNPAQRLERSAHFLENHDEPRVATRLSLDEHRAAALLLLGLPGMRLLHEGQLFGARRKIPVQLLRRLPEPAVPAIEALYSALFQALSGSPVGQGRWRLLESFPAWPDNPSAVNFVVIQWQFQPPEFDLVVLNLAPHQAQCRVRLGVPELSAHGWQMSDRLGPEKFLRSGEELLRDGLFLDLPAHGAQLFHFTPR